MESLNQIITLVPPYLSFILGVIGSFCLILTLKKPPKNKKTRTLINVGFFVGMLGFLPLFIRFITV